MFNTVMESGDHGPFNSWDRQVYVTTVLDGKTPSTTKAYDEITRNFFIGNWYGQEAIDNDDGSCYYNTHHNYFVYGGTGMKNDFNGHDNHHHDNVYAYITRGMGVCGALPGHGDLFTGNRVVMNNNGVYASYDCKCAKGTCPTMGNNSIYTPNGTMGDVCGQTLPDRQKAGLDIGTSVAKQPDDVTLISWGKTILGL